MKTGAEMDALAHELAAEAQAKVPPDVAVMLILVEVNTANPGHVLASKLSRASALAVLRAMADILESGGGEDFSGEVH